MWEKSKRRVRAGLKGFRKLEACRTKSGDTVTLSKQSRHNNTTWGAQVSPSRHCWHWGWMSLHYGAVLCDVGCSTEVLAASH